MTDIGAYEILGELGRGGMGCVYRARHRPTGVLRAVKVMSGGCDPESVVRFRREAESLARVGGRGVVVVHESGVQAGQLYFAMDLVAGGSLRSRLEKQGPFPWRDAVSLVVEIARVLERCHAAGLVHRDVKPDNVLLSPSEGAEDGGVGRPWLADFGCVRDLGASRLTKTGTSIGTLSYMAPEQLDGLPVDARADVYALAAVLHELVSGTRLFSGRSFAEQYTERQRPRPRLGAERAPAALERVLDRALAPRAADRTPSAAELALDLERVSKGLAPEKEPGASRRYRVVAGVLALGLGGAAALAAVLGGGRRGDVGTPAPIATSVTPLVRPTPKATDEQQLESLLRALPAHRLAALSETRGQNGDFAPFGAALYELGVKGSSGRFSQHDLLEAARRLTLPPPRLAADVARFWSREIEKENLTGDGLGVQILGLDASDESRDRLRKRLAELFRRFGEAYGSAPRTDVEAPWSACWALFSLAEHNQDREVKFATSILETWPDNPAVCLLEGHWDSLTKRQDWVEKGLAFVRKLRRPSGVDEPLGQLTAALFVQAVDDAHAAQDGPRAEALAQEFDGVMPCSRSRPSLAESFVTNSDWTKVLELPHDSQALDDGDRSIVEGFRCTALGSLDRLDELEQELAHLDPAAFPLKREWTGLGYHAAVAHWIDSKEWKIAADRARAFHEKLPGSMSDGDFAVALAQISAWGEIARDLDVAPEKLVVEEERIAQRILVRAFVELGHPEKARALVEAARTYWAGQAQEHAAVTRYLEDFASGLPPGPATPAPH